MEISILKKVCHVTIPYNYFLWKSVRKNIILEKKINKLHHKVTETEIFMYFVSLYFSIYWKNYFQTTTTTKKTIFYSWTFIGHYFFQKHGNAKFLTISFGKPGTKKKKKKILFKSLRHSRKICFLSTDLRSSSINPEFGPYEVQVLF